MLKKENKDIDAVLKAPSKFVNIFNKDLPEPTFEEQTINVKLFLMSAKEVGCNKSGQEKKTVTYTYYEDCDPSDKDLKRVRKQINVTSIFDADMKVKIPYDKSSGQIYENKVYNYAGHNNVSDESKGGIWWLRSPYIDNPDLGHPFRVTTEGICVANAGANGCAKSVVPAFCI